MPSMHVGTITFDWYFTDARVIRLVEAAAGAGCKVDVICLRQPHQKYYEVCNGVHIYRVPMSRGFGRPLPITILCWCWFLVLAGITVTWLHLRHPYDVIDVHNMPDFLVFSTLLPKLSGAKIVLDVQDVSPELMAVKASKRLRGLVVRMAIWQERISTGFADYVITAGWPFEKLLLQRGVPQDKLAVIINSADPKFFPPSRRSASLLPEASEDQRPFILMYHGTLARRNKLEIAIHALALARRVVPHLRLDIQGQGEQVPFLKRLAAELGVSDHVVFSNPCPPEEVVDFVLHGDLGIIPYGCDGFMELVLPTKCYEYAWMRIPMIASDTPAIRSMFRPESIVLCDPTSPESFAGAIIDLYQHPEKRAQMVAAAAEDYEPYRWELVAERYIQLLTGLSRKQAQKQRFIASEEGEL